MFRTSLPYLGSVALWAQLCTSQQLGFRQNESFQRKSQQTRTVIANSHGRQILSIPIEGGRSQRGDVDEIKISYREDWQRQHWLSIEAAYASAPFWNEYAPELDYLYQLKPQLLWEWNWTLLEHVSQLIMPGLVLAKAEGWLGEQEPITPALSELPGLEPYPQVFTERIGWQSNLSILDLLMCQGPAAASYLGRSSDR